MLVEQQVIVYSNIRRPRSHITRTFLVAALSCKIGLGSKTCMVGRKESIGICLTLCIRELPCESQVLKQHIFEIHARCYR